MICIIETSRKSSRIKKKPRHLEDYAVIALQAETYVEDLPDSLEEIASRDDKQEWMQAVKEEMP